MAHMNLAHEEMNKPFKVRGEEMVQKYIKQISKGKMTKFPVCKAIFKDLEDLNDHMEIFCKDCNSCVKSAYPKADWPLPDEEHCLTHQWVLYNIF